MIDKSDNTPVFRKVASFAGLACPFAGDFRYNGKPKKDEVIQILNLNI